MWRKGVQVSGSENLLEGQGPGEKGGEGECVPGVDFDFRSKFDFCSLILLTVKILKALFSSWSSHCY